MQSDAYLHRIDCLRAASAADRFLSMEPLLGPVPGISLEGIDRVIARGESGPGARPMEAEWMREPRDTAIAHEVPFFFRQ